MRKKNDKKKKGLLVAIFLVAIMMAVGYAALQAALTINAVGKIYSDWEVKFTDSTCEIESEYLAVAPDLGMECIADAADYDVEFDHLDLYTGGIDDNNDDSNKGIELALYTEFATPADETVFTIEITNFSSMWDAVLTSITQTPGSATADWIVYEFSNDLVADSGTINEDSGNATVLKAINSTGFTAGDNIVEFDITATWNEDYENEVPEDAIKKDSETTTTESYTQKDTFVLLWTAYAPGDY